MNPTSVITCAPASAMVAAHAKAYCGPAHGQSWVIDDVHSLPEQLDLEFDGAVHVYRLVHDPRAGRPARDHSGNYLYMPVSYGGAPSAVGPSAAPPRWSALRSDPIRSLRRVG